MTHTVAVGKCELAPSTNLFSRKSFLPIVTNTTFNGNYKLPFQRPQPLIGHLLPFFSPSSSSPCPGLDGDPGGTCPPHLLAPGLLCPLFRASSLCSAHPFYNPTLCALPLHFSVRLEEFFKWVIVQYPLRYKHLKIHLFPEAYEMQ